MSSGMSVSRKLSNCEKVRRAGDLKPRNRSSMEKGGRQEIRVQEAGEQGMRGGRFSPPCPPHKYGSI